MPGEDDRGVAVTGRGESLANTHPDNGRTHVLADFNAGDSLQNAFTELVAFLPNLFGALLFNRRLHRCEDSGRRRASRAQWSRFRCCCSPRAHGTVDQARNPPPVESGGSHCLLGRVLGRSLDCGRRARHRGTRESRRGDLQLPAERSSRAPDLHRGGRNRGGCRDAGPKVPPATRAWAESFRRWPQFSSSRSPPS